MDWTQFNWVDWTFVAVLLYGAAMGAVRGLSSELTTLIGMVVAAIVTRLFYEPLAGWVCGRWNWDPGFTRLVAVVLLALATLYGMRLLRIALGSLMTFAFKGVVERLGGLLTGTIRQGATFLVILLAASFVPSAWLQRAVVIDSQTGQRLLPYLLVEYNALANKIMLPPALVPSGVEQPYAVMPPLPEPGTASYPPPPAEGE